MNISAVNCTPIKPQAFGNQEGADEAQKVLELSKQLNDSFKKEGQDEEEVTSKNPLATAASVAGACLAMFALGRSAGKGAVALAKKIPAGAKDNVVKYATQAKTFVTEKASKIKMPKVKINLPKNEKVAGFFKNTVGKAATTTIEKTKTAFNANPEKFVKNTAGIIAASTLAPAIIKADGNKDGIADIAQNNVNAYRNAMHSVEIFSEIANALS